LDVDAGFDTKLYEGYFIRDRWRSLRTRGVELWRSFRWPLEIDENENIFFELPDTRPELQLLWGREVKLCSLCRVVAYLFGYVGMDWGALAPRDVGLSLGIFIVPPPLP
jgi:hypothetical protein